MDIEIKRVGAFYLDERRRFVNSSVLGRSYLHLPKNCGIDLAEGFPEKFDFVQISDEGITKVKRFLSDHEHLTRDVDFVTRRGTLAKILNLSGYQKCDIHVAKSGSFIYLADAPRPDRKYGDILEYCGRRFENIVFADTKKGPADHFARVNNAAGFYVVFKAEFAGFKFIYNAEVDGIDPDNSASDDLQDLSFVEAKVRKMGYGPNRFLGTMWAQSYLSGVDKIVIGWRNEERFLKSIQVFHPEQLRPKSADESLALLAKVMDYVQTLMMGVDDPKCIYSVSISKDKIQSRRYLERDSSLLK